MFDDEVKLPERETYSCKNCQHYRNESKSCIKGNEPKFNYGAHFLCDDFKKLKFSRERTSSVFDNYFKRA